MGSFTSNSPDETFELGRQWAADVSAGWVIGLMGDLGTGKTQLVKGLAAGLGVEATVNSPTFALLQEHDEGRLPLAHIDLYRLETPAEIVGASLEHFLTAPDGVAAIEWFERWLNSVWQPGQLLPESARPTDGVTLRLVILTDEGQTRRRIEYEDFGS